MERIFKSSSVGFIGYNLVKTSNINVLFPHTLSFYAVSFSDKSLPGSKNIRIPTSPYPLSQREMKDAKRPDVNVFLFNRDFHVDSFQLHTKITLRMLEGMQNQVLL